MNISSIKLSCPRKGLERGGMSPGGRKDEGSRERRGMGSREKRGGERRGNWGIGRGRWDSWRSRGRGRDKARGIGL